MKEFWSSVAFNDGQNSGIPLPKHHDLQEVVEWHFNIWLNLLEETFMATSDKT